MKRTTAFTVLPTCLWLLLGARGAQATDISGTISSTRVITDNSQLVGNVTCTVVGAPCIVFGASNIALKLNGFTMTGRATPPANCVSGSDFGSAPEDGINSGGQSGIAILGPGSVEGFGRQGMALLNSSRVRVEQVTGSDNCYSGIWLFATTNSDISHNFFARNFASAGFPCGGT